MFRYLVFLAGVIAVSAECKGQIYAKGISSQGKTDVVNIHNKYRLQIANGQVIGQPRGNNLKRMVYDQVLGDKGRVVSNTCKMDHIIAKDARWSWVGQNLFIEWDSRYNPYQNWTKAIASWFDENTVYNYNTNSGKNKNDVVGHYKQVVWANSKFIGCDFIHFYDSSKPDFPYSKLYTCNYGPGGNWNNEKPYVATGNNLCPNLCN